MRKLYALAAGLMTILVLAGVSAPVSAASNSLGVNPRRDYTIKAGSKVSDTLYVSNLSKTDDLNITISLVDFGPKDETGSPQLLLGRQDPTRWSLKPYTTLPASVTIAAGKSQEVPFTIAIPANVGAGSYYGAIKYSTSGDAAASNNVSLTSSSATLVFVRVPGEASDAMILRQFGAFTPNSDASSGSFGSLYGGSAPKYLSYRLQNKGNVAEQPSGSVEVKNIFGKQVKLFQNANPNSNVVLIDQTRRIDLCLNEQKTSHDDAASGREVEQTICNASKLKPGRYTAVISILYGSDGTTTGGSSHELHGSASFWYLPLWFIAVVAIAVLALAGIVWLVIRGLSARHRRFSRRR